MTDPGSPFEKETHWVATALVMLFIVSLLLVLGCLASDMDDCHDRF